MVYKPVIEVSKSKEYLDIMERLWFWPFYNTTDLFRVCSNTFRSDKKAQEFDFLNIKLVFTKFIE